MFNKVCVLILIGFLITQAFGAVFDTSSVVEKVIGDNETFVEKSKKKLLIENLKKYFYGFIVSEAAYYLDEQKWYIAGSRVSGDDFMLDTAEKHEYNEPKDVAYHVTFPAQNFRITHVSCLVEQSSKIGKAYIVDGGIGTNYMTIGFEARQTTYFHYIIYVFGKKY